MTKKTTKRSLLLSALSLLMCVSMLIGSTFAWFTDNVASGVNKIVAGNLDVELYWTTTPNDANSWAKVDKDTNVFKQDTLWEPGHTEVVYFKVVNEGSLALKYQFGVNINNEQGSVNVNNTDFKLSEFIQYGVIDGAETYTRDEAIAAVKANTTKLNVAYSSDVISLPVDDAATADIKENEKLVTMVVYIPTEVGNDANAKTGAAVPTILLGLNVFATQDTVESDSFGPDYDDAAWVVANADATASNATELNAALAQGGLIALTADFEGDITLDNVKEDTILNFAGKTINGTVTVAEGQEITINGQGGIAADGNAPALKVGKDTNVTVAGGTFTSESGAAIAIANAKTEVPMKLTIEEGTTVTAPTLISLDAMNGYAGAEIEINGGEFKATASGSYVRPINVNGGKVTINGGTFEATNATSYCYFIDVGEEYNTETNTYNVGSVTINDGYFKSTATYSRVVYGSIGDYSNRVPGTVTINGGTFEMLGTYGVLTDVGAHVVVNDCTFTGGGSNVFSITNNNTTDRTIEVKGGNYTIVPRNSTWSIPLGSFAGSYPTDTSPVGKVIISGGTINSYICDGTTIGGRTSVDLVADGYKVVDNSNGTWSVVVE